MIALGAIFAFVFVCAIVLQLIRTIFNGGKPLGQ